VREYSAPPNFTVGETGSLTDDVLMNARDFPDSIVLSRPINGEWADVSAFAFSEEVRETAKGLMAAGIAAGDRVALLSARR
jgi:long-chain acyl-CoA synthetase